MRARGERLREAGLEKPGGATCFPRKRQRGGAAAADVASSGSSTTGCCSGGTTMPGGIAAGEVAESAGLQAWVATLSVEEKPRGCHERVSLAIALLDEPAGAQGVPGSSAMPCANRTAAISARAAASTLACRAREAASPLGAAASLPVQDRLRVASRSQGQRGAPWCFPGRDSGGGGGSAWALAGARPGDNRAPENDCGGGSSCW